MRKTNFLKNTMMLLGTSLFVLTALTSCSEKEEIQTKQESIGTKGQPGCKGISSTEIVLNQRQWEFITPTQHESISPKPGDGATHPGPDTVRTSSIEFYMYVPEKDTNGSVINAVNVKTLLSNEHLKNYNNVAIRANISSYSMIFTGPIVSWYDEKCRIARIRIIELQTLAPIGVYVEYTTL